MIILLQTLLLKKASFFTSLVSPSVDSVEVPPVPEVVVECHPYEPGVLSQPVHQSVPEEPVQVLIEPEQEVVEVVVVVKEESKLVIQRSSLTRVKVVPGCIEAHLDCWQAGDHLNSILMFDISSVFGK